MSGPFGPGTTAARDPRRAARALSFGDDAVGYDEARPSYPAALVADLLGAGGERVVDVGCGTGKVARLLQDGGATVLGIEADERMAAVARGYGIDVEIARFEDFDPAGRSFSLLTAGQAWHWVDPVRGPAKAAELLEPGGRAALFWNLRVPPPPAVGAAFDACYLRHAPELAHSPMTSGTRPEARGLEALLSQLLENGRFDDGEARQYPWRCAYDTNAWRALLATQSDHRLLDVARREALLDATAAVVEGLGGSLEVGYVTLALFARRRG